MGSTHPKVLVVEDHSETRQLYSTALGFAGFTPLSVDDGLSALAILEADPAVSLVVLDLNLPRLDGRSVLHELRHNERTAHIPVIVVTGQDVDPTISQAALVLRKPCSPNRLLNAVEERLRAGQWVATVPVPAQPLRKREFRSQVESG